MYSWGSDDTTGWKNPGYDFGDAKKAYFEELKKEAPESRTYSEKIGPNLALVNPKGKTLFTKSKNPISILVDGTGSMQTWPAEIFDRLPLLYQTLVKYREDIDISFSVIGDAKIDTWPLQVGNYEKGVKLEEQLKALHAEGGGGPGIRESYELYSYFMLHHADISNAVKPFLFVMGDEKFYDQINTKQIETVIGDTVQGPILSIDIWKELGEKFDVYFLRKTYAPHDNDIMAQWRNALGEQKIVTIHDATRVVDYAIGIIADKWGQLDDFEKNLSARQDSKTVDKVMDSIKAASIVIEPGMKSKLLLPEEGTKSVSLMEVKI